MPRRLSANIVRVLSGLAAALLMAACGANTGDKAQPSTTHSSPAAAASLPPPLTAPPAPSVRTVKWVELQTGDCLADAPPTDPSVVTVTVVDCGMPHTAEVYARAPVGVDGALGDIAGRACSTAFLQYTGRSADGSSFAVTYLIDSNQDRTTDDPGASTVICLLQAADGKPSTKSARR
jgi:hypothetical protein